MPFFFVVVGCVFAFLCFRNKYYFFFFIESTLYARINRMSVVHPFCNMAHYAKCRILKDTVGVKKQRKILGSYSEIDLFFFKSFLPSALSAFNENYTSH